MNWLEATAGPGVIARLNRTMRAGTYSPAAFREIAGGEPDALWEQFKATLQDAPRTGPARPTTRQAKPS